MFNSFHIAPVIHFRNYFHIGKVVCLEMKQLSHYTYNWVMLAIMFCSKKRPNPHLCIIVGTFKKMYPQLNVLLVHCRLNIAIFCWSDSGTITCHWIIYFFGNGRIKIFFFSLNNKTFLSRSPVSDSRCFFFLK